MDEDKVLSLRFREMDIAGEIGALTSGQSLEDIAARISEVKRLERERKAAALVAKRGGKPPPYVPPGGWKMDPAKSLRIPPRIPKPDPVQKAKLSTTIDKFREMAKPRTWDGGFTLPPELDKELWRVMGGDTSGHRIFNLSRDDDKTCTRWKPGAYDKDLPQPTLDLLTPEYREVLKRHVLAAPVKVRQEYERMEKTAKTTSARELVARVGSDLAKLESSREQVLAEMAAAPLEESSSVFEKRR